MKTLFARVTNPLRPDYCDPVEVHGARTIREVLKNRYGENFVEFPRPTVILHNTRAALRAEWDSPLKHGDTVVELPIAMGIEVLIGLTIIAIVAAVVLAVTMKIPKIPGVNAGQGMGEPPSVYSLSGQRNQSRLNFPIEVPYGRNRLFPSYAAPWYNRYEKNSQFMYALFCLGQGEYDIEQTFIEDTLASQFPSANITIIPPGGTVEGVWPRVITSVEAATIELIAPNEVNYPGGMVDADPLPEIEGDPMGPLPPDRGWFGPYTLNPWGTKTWKIEVDIVLPGGAYQIDAETGDPVPLKMALQFQYRTVSDSGTLGEWAELWSFFYEPSENEEDFYSPDGGDAAGSESPTPLNMARRMTLSMTMSPARYQIRGRRLNKKILESNASHTFQWEAARAYLDTAQAFGDVTLVQLIARATNGVNNGSSNRVNCICTRKLPSLEMATVYTPVGEPVALDETWVNGTTDPLQDEFADFVLGGMGFDASVAVDAGPQYAMMALPEYEENTKITLTLNVFPSGAPTVEATVLFYFMDGAGASLSSEGEMYMPVTVPSGMSSGTATYTRLIPTGAVAIAVACQFVDANFPSIPSMPCGFSITDAELQANTVADVPAFTETLAATTDPIDAFCDIVRAKYGANLPDYFLDLVSLLALKERLAEIPYEFNYVYDQKSTVWDALSVVAQATRCIPTLNGSLITMVRDELTTIPLAVFTPENIVRGSFKLQSKLADVDEYDGLTVQYLDEESWAQETVLCKAKNGELVEIEEGLNPDNTRLAGVTNREQAYKEGLYMRQATRLMRSTVTFSTGLEGYIPGIGDMISVTFDVPKWGQSGYVVSFTNPLVFTLRERLIRPGALSDYRILFRTKSGKAVGPYTLSNDDEVENEDGSWTYMSEAVIDVEELEAASSAAEPTIFLWGVVTDGGWSKLAKILTATPNDDDTVEISAHIYDPDVFNGTEPGDPGPPPRNPGEPGGGPGDPGGFPNPPSPPPPLSDDYQFKLDERPMGEPESCEVDSPWKAFTTWKPWTYDVLSSTFPVIQIEVRKLEDEGYDDYFITPGGDSPLSYPFIVGKFQMRIRYVHCFETTIPPDPPEDAPHALIQIRQNPA